MGKLYLKNFATGLIFVCVSAIIAAIVSALLGLLAELLTLPFNAIASYIMGGVIGVICALSFKRFFIRQNGYFMPEDIAKRKDSVKNNFWINNIKDKKFIKKGAAQATYIPSFVLSLAIIILAGVFYSALQNAGEASSYIGYTVICAIIGASALSILAYGILGIRSLNVCKKCGSVNAFVYDEYLDFEMASGFKGAVSSKGGVHHGLTWGGWMPSHVTKLSRYGDVVSRHCACCGEKSTCVTQWDNSKVVQPQEPTKQ